MNLWTKDKFTYNDGVLKGIAKVGNRIVVIINIMGSRGVDYKFLNGICAHVIILHTPLSTDYSLVYQALSRGCRDSTKTCTGTLVVD